MCNGNTVTAALAEFLEVEKSFGSTISFVSVYHLLTLGPSCCKYYTCKNMDTDSQRVLSDRNS